MQIQIARLQHYKPYLSSISTLVGVTVDPEFLLEIVDTRQEKFTSNGTMHIHIHTLI